MIPATAATQKIAPPGDVRGRTAGSRARRWRMKNATSAASAIAARPSTSVPLFGTGAKLIASTSAATSTTDRMPPRLSTGSVASLTWAGPRSIAITSATTASGRVIRKTEPHQKCSSSKPDSSGPSAEIAPPSADHRAIDFVRAGPDHSAVISASVVGYAMPAASPPSTRATTSTVSEGAHAASRQAGIDEGRAQHEQQLAAVAIADRAEVEHRGGEPERVADRDQVRASSARSRTPCRCRAGRRSRRPGSGSRRPRRGSARAGRATRAPGPSIPSRPAALGGTAAAGVAS